DAGVPRCARRCRARTGGVAGAERRLHRREPAQPRALHARSDRAATPRTHLRGAQHRGRLRAPRERHRLAHHAAGQGSLLRRPRREVPRHHCAGRALCARAGPEGEIPVSKKKQIGRYKILGELGRGAMGVVYRAEDPALDRVVALKTILLSDDVDNRKEYEKRFALEARAAGKLNHPNIVTTFDFGEEGDLAFLAMELLEGTDLRTRLKDKGLATDEAVEIAVQVADGLGFAHERGVVHRDIKPGNIM